MSRSKLSDFCQGGEGLEQPVGERCKLPGHDGDAHDDHDHARTDLERPPGLRRRTRAPVKNADARNGRPSPNAYAESRVMPLAVFEEIALSVRITPSTGPMHGVQPAPNARPSPYAHSGRPPGMCA